MILGVTIELDNNRRIKIHPRSGVEPSAAIYPLELKLVNAVMKVLERYVDHFDKPVKEKKDGD